MKTKKIIAIFTILILVTMNLLPSFSWAIIDTSKTTQEAQDVAGGIQKQEEIIKEEKAELLKLPEKTDTTTKKKSVKRYSAQRTADPYAGALASKRSLQAIKYAKIDGKNYIYGLGNYYDALVLIKMCVETGSSEQIYFNNTIQYTKPYKPFKYFVKGDTIYFRYWLQNNANMTILEYNILTGPKDTYEIPIEYNTYNAVTGGFAVDNNKNFYFTIGTPVSENSTNSETNTIVSYNTSGNLIDSYTWRKQADSDSKKTYKKLEISNISSDDTRLFLYGYYGRYDNVVVQINNGRFTNKNGYYRYSEASAWIDWTFLNETSTLGHTQNGEMYTIEYIANGNVAISALGFMPTKNYNDYVSTITYSDGNIILIGTQRGYIYQFNIKDKKIEKTLYLGDGKSVDCIYVDGNDFIIEYYNNNGCYVLKTSSSNIKAVKDVVVTEHTSGARTKEEIKTKSEELSIKCTGEDIYEVEPKITSPYLAGKLKAQVETDTLNQINYFRYLAGLSGVKINEAENRKYMNWAQEGAVILSANDELTHYPAKPSGMEQEFYEQGYDATSCGFGNSANCSQGSLMADSIKGYVDDTNNVYVGVGHRLSMLDPKASHTTFGAAGPTSPHTGRVYGVVNMFNLEETSNNDQYYAWPSAGNFPIESIDKDAMWSFKGNGYLTTVPEITITAGGNKYKSSVDFDIYMDQSWKTMCFYIDRDTTNKELKNYLTNNGTEFESGRSAQVEVRGYSDETGDNIIYKYTVDFFSLKDSGETPIPPVSLEYGDISKDGKIDSLDAIMALMMSTNIMPGTAEQRKIADVSGEREITSLDAMLILLRSVMPGFVFPVEKNN